MEQTEELTYAYFFFTDIVGLSDPRIPTKRQIKKIEGLTNLITSCEAFKNTEPGLMLYLPTGDGMAIGFLSGPELPLMLAVELHKKLRAYNMGKFPEEILRIRIGINDGPVYIVRGMSGSNNLWGPGILLARSIMDMGDDDHILLSPQTAEVLRELPEFKDLIKPVHDYKMKDGNSVLIYSVYGDGVGNPHRPKKGLYQRRMMKKYVEKIKDTITYKKIEVTLTITDPKAMLIHYKKLYNIENISNEPLQNVLHNITTHVRKSFGDMSLRISDESGRELRITSINLDTPFQKEFTTMFNTPILKGEKTRSYTLEYEAEEPKRYFESYAANCSKYTVSLIYPSNTHFKPAVYDVKKGKKAKSKTQPTIRKLENGIARASWNKSNITEGQTFRLEW
jgi:hypothetical protein